jgi:hypothetical protein
MRRFEIGDKGLRVSRLRGASGRRCCGRFPENFFPHRPSSPSAGGGTMGEQHRVRRVVATSSSADGALEGAAPRREAAPPIAGAISIGSRHHARKSRRPHPVQHHRSVVDAAHPERPQPEGRGCRHAAIGHASRSQEAAPHRDATPPTVEASSAGSSHHARRSRRRLRSVADAA